MLLLQAKALTALVSQISSASSNPLADLQAPSSLSTRGTAGRQKLQLELAARDGCLFERVYSAAARRMYPAMRPASASELCQRKYLERYGGYGQHRDLGLIQWQLAQSLDLLAMGEVKGAADLTAQLMVMVEQLSLDGKSDLAWLLTLQHDPPASIFLDHQALPSSGLRPFSPLADQRLVTTTLAYVRELEGRVLENKASPCTSSKGKGRGVRAGGGTTPHAQAAPCQTVGREESCRRQSVGHGPESATACPPGADSSDALPDACFRGKLSFFKWAAALPRLLLATRTSFARFLKSSFAVNAHQEDQPPSTALFPLPVPVPGLFQKRVPKSGSQACQV